MMFNTTSQSKRYKRTKKTETETVDVDALIRKGGSVAGDAKSLEQPDKPTSVILRIPADVIVKVEKAVLARRLKTPRHTWLLEAIMEKLDREEANS
jgi:hypothetical protein